MTALARNLRLGGADAVKNAMRRGRRIEHPPLFAHILENKGDFSRLAVVVPKSVDKRAVVRNRIRRRVLEIMRHILPKIKNPANIVIRAGLGSEKMDFKQIKYVLERAFKVLENENKK